MEPRTKAILVIFVITGIIIIQIVRNLKLIFSFFRVAGKAITILVAILAVLFQVNVDVKHTLCMMGATGYLDFLGLSFSRALEKCIAETSTFYLHRDLKPGDGKLINIKELDCTKNVTFEDLDRESKGFTIPFICKGLLKDNACRKWDFDYLLEHSNRTQIFDNQLLEPVPGHRRAFMRVEYPRTKVSIEETFRRMKQGDPVYVSFDNYYIERNPTLLNDLNLKNYFPNMKWILHTAFISNFTQPTLGSPFHAAPNDNFFFQCRGNKQWYYMEPSQLKYVAAYVSKGVTLTTDAMSEVDIVDRVKIYQGFVEEGDMMYNPPFWLHAVGTTKGITISVANRAWNRIIPQPDNVFFDAIYKFGFPRFFFGVLAQRLSGADIVSSLTLNDAGFVPESVLGGVLPVPDR